jgi:hypothetical protein
MDSVVASTVTSTSVFDFRVVPELVDPSGRVSWDRLFALQANVVIGRQQAVIHQLVASIEAMGTCSTCGAQPCVNPSFCSTCRAVDRRPVYLTRRVPRARPTPGATIEAVKHAVRSRGTNALNEPATDRRLRACDAAALAEIDRWLAKKGLSR